MATFDMDEVRTLAVDLSAAGDRVGASAAAVIRKAALDVQAEAQRNAPVDTGNLRSSISTTFTGDGRFSSMAAEVGPTASYGFFVEHGTSRMSGQPFLFPALDRVAPSFEAAMADIIGEGIV